MNKCIGFAGRNFWRVSTSVAALCVALSPLPSLADVSGSEKETAELTVIQQELQALMQRLERQKQTIEVQEDRIKALEQQVEATAAAAPSRFDYYPDYYDYPDSYSNVVYRPQEPFRPSGRVPAQYHGGTATEQPARNGPGAVNQAQGTGGQSAPASQVDIPAVARNQSALLPPGTLVVEPSVQYSLTSLNRVTLAGFTVIPAITVGSIDVRKVDREVLVSASTFRLGVSDFFEVDVKVPFVYRRDSTTTRPLNAGSDEDQTTSTNGWGLGDVELGAHLQLWDGSNGGPFVIFNTRVLTPTGKDPFEIDLDENGLEEELPTGSGFWGVEPSMTFLYPSDPVVFFGTMGYLFNLAADKDVQGSSDSIKINPGDAVRMSLGLGFAINEDSSFSLGYQHDIVFPSKVGGTDVDDSDLHVGKLLIGGSYQLNDRTAINLSVGVGATEEAPDVDLMFRIPIRFSQLF